jgi:hypothetical protein
VQCWVSADYQDERLWLHYLWIFIVEFGTIGIYGHIFIHLRGRIQSIINNDTTKLTRATKFMVMYPAVYVILTLPIAVGRMVAMTGTPMPDVFFIIAGSLLTSCGWIDALLYTLTRRILVSNEISTIQYDQQYGRTAITTVNTTHAGTRPGDIENYGLMSMDKEMAARSVTIVGGSNRLSRMVDSRLGRSQSRRTKLDSVRDDHGQPRLHHQKQFARRRHSGPGRDEDPGVEGQYRRRRDNTDPQAQPQSPTTSRTVTLKVR